MSEHRFVRGGYCIWCKTATPEKVADRRAPPYCPEAPEDVQRQDMDESRASGNAWTGY